MNKNLLKEILNRYIFAEIFATIGAIFGAIIIYLITENKISAAFGGTIGENIGFYSYIISKDMYITYTNSKYNNSKYIFRKILIKLRNIFLEFGIAEFLDSFFIRPFFMYIAIIYIHNFIIAIFTGKIISDIFFYIPTSITYILEKKYLSL